MSDQKELGQYFTKNKELKECVYNFVRNKPDNILEPSIGRGDLVSLFPDVVFDMYEIDESIKFLDCINACDVIFGDFLKQEIRKRYKTIIGNPPYVKVNNYNLYIKFIDKCFELLDDDGELIFIVPSDFFKVTSAGKIINKMLQFGNFTDIFHPHNEKLFENANVDVIVFRYVKTCETCQETKIYVYNGKEMCIKNTNGIITFYEKIDDMINICDLFNVYVGIVSGKESIFKNDIFGNVDVLNGLNKIEKYILIDSLPKEGELLEYLESHKNTLLTRKIRKFDEKNWFEWGALRNKDIVVKNKGGECIYVSTLSRKDIIAFQGNVMYFGGSLLMLLPKKKVNISKIVEYLNSSEFKKNYIFSGRFKIGQKQLLNAYIQHNLIDN